QRGKFLIAIADAWLMAHADYHASYRVRRQRFAALTTGVFPEATRAAIDAAFAAKLTGAPLAQVADAVVPCGEALAHLERTLGWHRDPDVVRDALARIVARRVRAGRDWIAGAGARGLVAAPSAGTAATAPAAAIYRALVESVRSWTEPEGPRFARLAAALAPEFAPPAGAAADLSGAVARTWLTFFHP
ncbi:MAG TPA: hypothetical protein VMW48_19545, partial [Vicinamibacterales bacterium]|nr:hypothetical protein [Vicinamibacterales bacterium]